MPQPKETTWIAILDGRKALVLENRGTDLNPDLVLIEKREEETPPSRELGPDRPGRRADKGPNQRSAMEAPDRHTRAEELFAADMGVWLAQAARSERFDRLVLAAAPRVMGHVRGALGADATRRIAAELTQDLVNHPIPEIAEKVRGVLKPGF